jgi:hypothetical protein
VGGTAIAEWGRGQTLYRGMLRRARAAQATSPGGQIDALLWYQGETDALDEGAAEAYEGALDSLLTSLRADLGQPELPVLLVNVGGVEAKLPRLARVRAAVAAVARGQRARGLLGGLVDAEGSALRADNLHLTAAAQMELGGRLAAAAAGMAQLQ